MDRQQNIQQLIGLMQKNLECAICLELIKNPVSTKCDHQFCGFCLKEFLKTKRSVPCPLCKKEITKRSLVDRPHLSEIVDNVRALVTAFQLDTGQVFSPPRGPQMNFLPSTPEDLITKTTRGSKRKQKDEASTPAVPDNTRLSKRRRSDTTGHTSQSRSDVGGQGHRKTRSDVGRQGQTRSSTTHELVEAIQKAGMIPADDVRTAEMERRNERKCDGENKQDRIRDVPQERRVTRSRTCRHSNQTKEERNKTVKKTCLVDDGLLQYLANESCGAVETANLDQSASCHKSCDQVSRDEEKSLGNVSSEEEDAVDMTYTNVEDEEKEEDDNGEVDEDVTGMDLISLGQQAKILKEKLQGDRRELVEDVRMEWKAGLGTGKPISETVSQDQASTQGDELDENEAETTNNEFMLFSDVDTKSSGVRRGRQKLDFQSKRRYLFREKTAACDGEDEVTQLSGHSIDPDPVDGQVFSGQLVHNVSRTYGKKRDPKMENEKKVKKWLTSTAGNNEVEFSGVHMPSTGNNGDLSEVDMPSKVASARGCSDGRVSTLTGSSDRSRPAENSTGELIQGTVDQGELFPMFKNRRKIFKTKSNHPSTVSTSIQQVKGSFVVRKVSPVREAVTDEVEVVMETGTCEKEDSQKSDPFEFKTSQRTPKSVKGKKKVAKKALKKCRKNPINIKIGGNTNSTTAEVVDLTLEENEENQRSRSANKVTDSSVHHRNERGGRSIKAKGKKVKSPEMQSRRTEDVEKIIADLSQAEEYDFITCTQEARDSVSSEGSVGGSVNVVADIDIQDSLSERKVIDGSVSVIADTEVENPADEDAHVSVTKSLDAITDTQTRTDVEIPNFVTSSVDIISGTERQTGDHMFIPPKRLLRHRSVRQGSSQQLSTQHSPRQDSPRLPSPRETSSLEQSSGEASRDQSPRQPSTGQQRPPRQLSPALSSPRQPCVQHSPKQKLQQQSPRQQSPKQQSPRQQSPRQLSPRKQSPRNSSPRQHSLRQLSLRQPSPRRQTNSPLVVLETQSGDSVGNHDNSAETFTGLAQGKINISVIKFNENSQGMTVNKKQDKSNAECDVPRPHVGQSTEDDMGCVSMSSRGTCIPDTDDSIMSKRTKKLSDRFSRKKTVTFTDKVQHIDDDSGCHGNRGRRGQRSTEKGTVSPGVFTGDAAVETLSSPISRGQLEVTADVQCIDEETPKLQDQPEKSSMESSMADIIPDTLEGGSTDFTHVAQGDIPDSVSCVDLQGKLNGERPVGQSQTFDPDQENYQELMVVSPSIDVCHSGTTEESLSTQPPSEADLDPECGVKPVVMVTRSSQRCGKTNGNLTTKRGDGATRQVSVTAKCETPSVVMETQMSNGEDTQTDTQESVSLLVFPDVRNTDKPDVVVLDGEKRTGTQNLISTVPSKSPSDECFVVDTPLTTDLAENSGLRTRRNKLKRHSPKMANQSFASPLSCSSGSKRSHDRDNTSSSKVTSSGSEVTHHQDDGKRSNSNSTDLDVIPATLDASKDSTPIIQITKIGSNISRADDEEEDEKLSEEIPVSLGKKNDPTALFNKISNAKVSSSGSPRLSAKKSRHSKSQQVQKSQCERQIMETASKSPDHLENESQSSNGQIITDHKNKNGETFVTKSTGGKKADENVDEDDDLVPTLKPIKQRRVKRQKCSPDDIFMMDSETPDGEQDLGQDTHSIAQNQEGMLNFTDFQPHGESMNDEDTQNSELGDKNSEYQEEVNVKSSNHDVKLQDSLDKLKNGLAYEENECKIVESPTKKDTKGKKKLGKNRAPPQHNKPSNNDSDSDSDLSQPDRKSVTRKRCVRGLARRIRQTDNPGTFTGVHVVNSEEMHSVDSTVNDRHSVVENQDFNVNKKCEKNANESGKHEIEEDSALLFEDDGKSCSKSLDLKEKFRKTFRKRDSPRLRTKVSPSDRRLTGTTSRTLPEDPCLNGSDEDETENPGVDTDKIVKKQSTRSKKCNKDDELEPDLVIPDSFPSNPKSASDVSKSSSRSSIVCVGEPSLDKVCSKSPTTKISCSPLLLHNSNTKSDNQPESSDDTKSVTPEIVDIRKRIIGSRRRRPVIMESDDDDDDDDASSPLPDVICLPQNQTKTMTMAGDVDVPPTVVLDSDNDNDDDMTCDDRELDKDVDDGEERNDDKRSTALHDSEEKMDISDGYISSDDSDSSRHLNLTSSSAFSSQSEAMTTQNRNALEKDLERMKNEIAELENQLASNPPQTDKSLNRSGSKTKRCLMSEDFDSGSLLGTEDRTNRENNNDVVNVMTSSPGGPLSQEKKPNDSDAQMTDSDDSNELFLSPLPPSPPPTPSQSSKKARVQLPPYVLKTTEFLSHICENKSPTKSESSQDCFMTQSGYERQNNKNTNANRTETLSQTKTSVTVKYEKKVETTTICSSPVGGTGNLQQRPSPMFETKPSQLLDRRHALSPLVDDTVNRDRRQHKGFITTGLLYLQMREIQKLAQQNDSKFYVKFSPAVTHVIVKTVPVGSRVCERTLKFFQAVAHQCWVLDYTWVTDSKAAGKLLPEDKYEVIGDTVTSDSHYGPRRSRLSRSRLLEGYQFYCVSTSDSLTKEDLEDLIAGCGGSTVTDPSKFSSDAKLPLVVTCTDLEDEDDVPSREDIRTFNKLYRTYGVLTVSRDWVLDTLTVYTIQPLEDYVLTTVKDKRVPEIV